MSTQRQARRVERPAKDLPSNVWSSIFRNPLPSTDLERSSTSFTNFFLHIHPVKVHRNTLRPIYTLGLGLMSTFLFFILVATGILLMFYYVPSTTQAYDRMLDLRGTRGVRHLPAQHAPLERARHGGHGFPAHVPRVPHRRRTRSRASSTG